MRDRMGSESEARSLKAIADVWDLVKEQGSGIEDSGKKLAAEGISVSIASREDKRYAATIVLTTIPTWMILSASRRPRWTPKSRGRTGRSQA